MSAKQKATHPDFTALSNMKITERKDTTVTANWQMVMAQNLLHLQAEG